MAGNLVRARFKVDTRLATEDIQAFGRALRKTDKRKVARRAAKYVARFMERQITPKSKADHTYRRKSTVPRQKKRGKDANTVTIKSGNLRKSTRIFTFRKSEMLHVGPKYLLGFSGNTLGGSKRMASGFYARWIVEGKTKAKSPNDYMGKIYESTAQVTKGLVVSDWEIALDRVSDRALRRGISKWEKYYQSKGRI
jgi:hypothetical protein